MFGGGACRVPGCQRSARGHGLCQGHGQRWVDAGRPDPDVFAATTDPRWRRQQPNAAVRGRPLRLRHRPRWVVFSARPAVGPRGQAGSDRWLAAAPAVKQPAAGCCLPHRALPLWPQAASPFCHAHANAWRGQRPPGPWCVRPTGSSRGPARQRDHPSGRARPAAAAGDPVRAAVPPRPAPRQDPPDGGLAGWCGLWPPPRSARCSTTTKPAGGSGRAPSSRTPTPRGLLMFTHRVVADLAEGDGWDGEYGRDVWQHAPARLHGTGVCGSPASPSPGCGSLAKRLAPLRLSRGLGLEAGGARSCALDPVLGVPATHRRRPHSTELDRVVLEHYLADLHAS